MKLNESPQAFIKAILMGLSGTGKSGSTVCLAVPGIVPNFPGYKLRVVDFDSKYPEIALSILNSWRDKKVISPDQYTQALENIDVEACGEPMAVVKLPGQKSTGLSITNSEKKVVGVNKSTKAYSTAVNALQRWEYDSETIVILDSLTHAAQAIVNFALELNGNLNKALTWQMYPDPQSKLMLLLQYLADLPCSALILAHQTTHEVYKKTGQKDADGNDIEELISSNVVPVSIGKAKSVEVPARMNHLLAYVTEGSGKSIRRSISTKPTQGIITKSPFLTAPDSLPIDKGLAQYWMLRP
jgi:hypothetical protein